MKQATLIYERILDNMSGGVMSLGSDGRIITYNPAAARILGIPREEAVGRLFAEVFLGIEHLDDFNQVIVDAVYDVDVDQQRIIEIRRGDTVQSLALTTSYLQATKSGETRKIGVIAIFSDITEVRELRDAELRSAQSIKTQHTELQNAYRQIEENNRALASASKRGRIATIFVIGLFLAAGFYAWDMNLPSAFTGPPGLASNSKASDSADLRLLVVRPQRTTSTISVSGQLAPRREVAVASPIAGKVIALHFQYGERVAKGQLLVNLDTSDVERDHRDARAAYIKAARHFREIESWENNIEVARARRSLSKATLTLETQKNKLEETAFLLRQGIIPASEHAAAKRQYRNQMLDYETSRQGLQVVLAKGGADEKRVARLELDNAHLRLQELEEILKRATITAPVTGIILQPSREGEGKSNQGSKHLARGRSVAQGERLLTIGDLGGLSVTGQVDEVDVAKVRPGQRVAVSGDAFHDLDLQGTVGYISSQARQRQAKKGPATFEVTVALENLTEAQRQRLRLGMSADLEIVVYDKPDALLVPISAVQVLGDETWVRIRNKETGALQRVRVDVGVTTLDAVEIASGIEAGDEVVLPGA